MLNESRQRSALDGLRFPQEPGSNKPEPDELKTGSIFAAGSAATVRVEEIPFVALANLRGDPGNPAFMSAVSSTLGFTLPVQPNTTAENERACALWLGPDEWMIRSTVANDTELAIRLDAAVQGIFSAVTDQSSGHSVLQLTGPQSNDLLAKGCPLDLHPRVFAEGQCAQSHYYKSSFLLRRLPDLSDNEPRWEVILRRSFAEYAVRMLVADMRAYE